MDNYPRYEDEVSEPDLVQEYFSVASRSDQMSLVISMIEELGEEIKALVSEMEELKNEINIKKS